MNASPLIDVATLARNRTRPDWIVVDCRFTLTQPAAGRASYDKGHIPGARYAHLDEDLSRKPGPAEGRHPLPDPAAFAATLGAWGIEPGHTVIAYDEGSGAIAARLWWLLRWLGHDRCAVLDGGFAAWVEAGHDVESHAPNVAARRYPVPEPRTDLVVTSRDLAAQQAAGAVVVDARAAARYTGEQETIDPVAGHVPHARNRPFSSNVTPSGRFRPPGELRRELLELLAGREPSRLIAMCGSGVTACQLLLAMEVAGLAGGRLYAGSWSEWIRDPSRPLAKGADR
ncbi:MAG TPA: sulfurtransferase [Gammaproteobacteria bacterium]